MPSLLVCALLGCHPKTTADQAKCSFGTPDGGAPVAYRALVRSGEAYHRRTVRVRGWYGGDFEEQFFWESESARRPPGLSGERIKLAELPEFKGRIANCRGFELTVVGEFVDEAPVGPLPAKVIIVHGVHAD